MNKQRQLRLTISQAAYERLEQLGHEKGMTVPQFAQRSLEGVQDDHSTFHLHMAAKFAYMAFMTTWTYLPLIYKDADFEDGLKASLAKMSHGIFGDPPVQPAIQTSPNTNPPDELVVELMTLFQRYSANRFAAAK